MNDYDHDDDRDDRDDARADDFRCHGCETPLPLGFRGPCMNCRDENKSS